MGKVQGHMTSLHPPWLDVLVPPDYEDEDLYRIILFFVIHSPCPGQSARGISLQKRGWKPKPWYSPPYLKDRLDRAIWGNDPPRLTMVESREALANKLLNHDMDDDFFCHRECQRALYVRVTAPGCSSVYMSLFYHMRNAFAHGRLAMYPGKDGDIIFVMEDGSENKQSKEHFEISARMVFKKSSLLKIIDVITDPPIEIDYTDDILRAISKGFYTKAAIMRELEMSETAYEHSMQRLKLQNKIEYKRNKWVALGKEPTG